MTETIALDETWHFEIFYAFIEAKRIDSRYCFIVLLIDKINHEMKHQLASISIDFVTVFGSIFGYNFQSLTFRWINIYLLFAQLYHWQITIESVNDSFVRIAGCLCNTNWYLIQENDWQLNANNTNLIDFQWVHYCWGFWGQSNSIFDYELKVVNWNLGLNFIFFDSRWGWLNNLSMLLKQLSN